MTLPPMRRREFLMLAGGTAAAWPVAAKGQQAGKLPTVGYLGANTVAGEFARTRPAPRLPRENVPVRGATWNGRTRPW
jgi:hypothetical protein